MHRVIHSVMAIQDCYIKMGHDGFYECVHISGVSDKDAYPAGELSLKAGDLGLSEGSE